MDKIKIFLVGITIIIFCVIMILIHMFQYSSLSKMPNKTKGKIIGILKSTPFNNEKIGDIPDGAIMGWGVSQGEQYYAKSIKVRFPFYFPCVMYKLDNQQFIKILGVGGFKNTYTVGDEVEIAYDINAPRKAIVLGDKSYKYKYVIYLSLIIIIITMTILLLGVV